MKKHCIKTLKILLLVTISAFLLAGCSDDTDGNDEEKITLIVATDFPEDLLEERVADRIKEEFPHVQLDHYLAHAESLEELIAGGIAPDLSINIGHHNIDESDLLFDLEELVESIGFDLSTVEPSLLEAIRSQNEEGKLWALPFQGNIHALFYNKDIFDKFGINYPTDHMTWDEVVDLARDVTGEMDGVQFRGLEINAPHLMLGQYPVDTTDPETEEVVIDKEPVFTKAAEVVKALVDIPGLYDPEGEHDFFTTAGFEEGTTAMTAAWGAGHQWLDLESSGVSNFDVVTFPTWDEQPNIDPRGVPMPLSIGKHSEHKEEIAKIFAHLLSDENQKWIASIGLRPVLADISEDIMSSFGTEMGEVHEDNVQAYFLNTPGFFPEGNAYWSRFIDENEAFEEFANGSLDVNTFIREFQEAAEAEVANAKESQ